MKNVGGKERALRAVFGSFVVVADFLANVQIEILFLIVGLWACSPQPLATARLIGC